MDGYHSIRDCAFPSRATGLHSAEHRDPPGGTPPAGRAGPPRPLAQPEPQHDWDTTESVMSAPTPHCDQVFEVRNCGQLVACVDEITTN
jgi:hypothetical protein